MRAWCCGSWISVLLLAACSRASAPRQVPKPVPSPAVVAAPAVPRVLGELGTTDAFELVTTSDGALALWVAPGSCSQSLRLQRFDAQGRAQGAARVLGLDACAAAALPAADARVSELAATAAGGHLGLVWIAQSEQLAAVLGSYAPDSAQTFGPPQRLSAAEARSDAVRGRLSLSAAETGAMRVAFRAPVARCVGQSGDCAQLVTQAYPPLAGAAARVADAREIRTPCLRMLAGATWVSGTWYDAFCALGEQDAIPTTQVYAIRPEISYAAAVPTLRECMPLGLSPAPKGAVMWGDCAGERTAHVITLDGRERTLAHAITDIRCAGGRPLLRVSGEGDPLELKLDEPRDRIELWLPTALAPAGARAVFTGSRLIVVSARGPSLGFVTYRCQGDQLVPDAAAML